jgi:uncharacterized protein
MSTTEQVRETTGEREYKAPFVVDAVIHAFNLTEENTRTPLAQDFLAMTYGLVALTGDAEHITQEDFLRNWTAEDLADVVFAQSDVDLGVFHGVPWFDYFHDGFCANEKGIEMLRRWPDRVMFYGTLDPLRPDAVEQATYLVEEAGARGIKLYPENWHHEERRAEPVMLDSDRVRPVLEKALEFGVPLAIHKVIPAGQGHTENYRLTDVEAAARAYPDLQIEVVHSGFAFIEETAYLLARYPNVWANLETTTAYVVNAQGRFAQALGGLLATGAWDRIIFASGAVQTHPQTLLEAMYDFQIPMEMTTGFGIPQITPEIRDGILGMNFARLHGLDHEATLDRIDDDEFSQRKKNGLEPRWKLSK